MPGIESIIQEIFTEYGIVGIIILCLLWVIRELWRDKKESDNSRLEDIKEHSKELAEVIRESNRALDAAVRAIQGRNNG